MVKVLCKGINISFCAESHLLPAHLYLCDLIMTVSQNNVTLAHTVAVTGTSQDITLTLIYFLETNPNPNHNYYSPNPYSPTVVHVIVTCFLNKYTCLPKLKYVNIFMSKWVIYANQPQL